MVIKSIVCSITKRALTYTDPNSPFSPLTANHHRWKFKNQIYKIRLDMLTGNCTLLKWCRSIWQWHLLCIPFQIDNPNLINIQKKNMCSNTMATSVNAWQLHLIPSTSQQCELRMKQSIIFKFLTPHNLPEKFFFY